MPKRRHHRLPLALGLGLGLGFLVVHASVSENTTESGCPSVAELRRDSTIDDPLLNKIKQREPQIRRRFGQFQLKPGLSMNPPSVFKSFWVDDIIDRNGLITSIKSSLRQVFEQIWELAVETADPKYQQNFDLYYDEIVGFYCHWTKFETKVADVVAQINYIVRAQTGQADVQVFKDDGINALKVKIINLLTTRDRFWEPKIARRSNDPFPGMPGFGWFPINPTNRMAPVPKNRLVPRKPAPVLSSSSAPSYIPKRRAPIGPSPFNLDDLLVTMEAGPKTVAPRPAPGPGPVAIPPRIMNRFG